MTKKPIYFKFGGINLNLTMLKHRLTQSIVSFGEEVPLNGGVETVQSTNYTQHIDNRYFFRDNGSNILAVAHLDTALQMIPIVPMFPYYNGFNVVSPQLDDRMGAFILLDVLPKLKILPDILLTVGEEYGASTAACFTTKKKYNWGFEFDRNGHDTVLYQYGHSGSEIWQEAIKSSGLQLGHGSFSDIAELDHLGCKFMNIGCGYHGEHNTYCYAILEETCVQINRFKNFWNMYKDERFIHTREPYKWWKGNVSYGKSSVGRHCARCGISLLANEYETGFCDECLNNDGEEGARPLAKKNDDAADAFNVSGERICKECGAVLYAHEMGFGGMCEDCYQWHQRNPKIQETTL
jgi:hypothetical protein